MKPQSHTWRASGREYFALSQKKPRRDKASVVFRGIVVFGGMHQTLRKSITMRRRDAPDYRVKITLLHYVN